MKEKKGRGHISCRGEIKTVREENTWQKASNNDHHSLQVVLATAGNEPLVCFFVLCELIV